MNKKSIFKYGIFLLLVCVFLICGFVYSCTDEGDGSIITETLEEALISDSSASMMEGDSSVSLDDTQAEVISEAVSESQICYVYVCGQVNSPGVYEASQESRIYEVIEAAGGATENGCLEALNLAEPVYDGRKIYVPSYEEYELSGRSEWQNESEQVISEQSPDSGLININTADVNTLMNLPGIGSTRAAAIVEYRRNNGSFECIEDIMKVSGIKEGAYNKIKDLICTE